MIEEAQTLQVPLRMTLKIYPAHDRDCDSRNTPKGLAALYSPVSS